MKKSREINTNKAYMRTLLGALLGADGHTGTHLRHVSSKLPLQTLVFRNSIWIATRLVE